MANQELNENWDQEIYDKFHSMACKLAGKHSTKYNLPYEEMKLEAEYSLAVALLSGTFRRLYDPKKGSISTWMYNRIYWDLKEYNRRQTKEPSIDFTSACDEDVDLNFVDPKPWQSWIERLLSEVSEEASFIIKAIVSAPIELLDNKNERKCRRWIKDMRGMDTDYAKRLIEEYATGGLLPRMSKEKFNLVKTEVANCL